jgi:hypothetical protein
MPLAFSRFSGRQASYQKPTRDLYGMEEKFIGQRRFGEATLALRFLSRQSRWGLYTGEPAGILLLDIELSQPGGYKLRDACLDFVFLGYEGSELDAFSTAAASRPLYIIDRIAPNILCGTVETDSKGTREIQVVPELGADGLFSLGGVGYRNAKEIAVNHRWGFETHCLGDDQGSVKVAQLLWFANPDQDQNEFAGSLRVGIAVAHNKAPFYVSLNINGNLVKGRFLERLKYTFGKAEPTIARIYPENKDHDLAAEIEKLQDLVKPANPH